MKTLVILGASITALAVARDARSHGLESAIVDWKYGPASRSKHVRAIRIDKSDDDSILRQLMPVAGRDSALISTSDDWLRFIVRNRSFLDGAFGAVLHPKNEALDTCLDKLEFSRWCRANDLPTPATWIGSPGERPIAARFPLLIRPARTMHARVERDIPKAIQVSSQRELDDWLHKFNEAAITPLVSESLLGRKLEQVSVAFARRSQEILLLGSRKIRPSAERCSVGSCVELRANPQAEEFARRAATLLDYFGIGEVEILQDLCSGEQFIVEINARPWLQYSLAPASGHDFLGLVLNLPSRRRVPILKSGKTWIHLHDDLFNAFSRSVGEVRHGRTSALAYLASIMRCNVFALMAWRDPGPFIASLRRDGR